MRVSKGKEIIWLGIGKEDIQNWKRNVGTIWELGRCGEVWMEGAGRDGIGRWEKVEEHREGNQISRRKLGKGQERD